VHGLKWATLAADAAWQRGIGMVPHNTGIQMVEDPAAKRVLQICVSARSSRVAPDVEGGASSSRACQFMRAPAEQGEE